MYKAIDVAWKVLSSAKRKDKKISNLQLQKLTYIAHGYFLGWKDKPLISDPIEAWTYGPVISSIYHQFKEYGDKKIQGNPNSVATKLDNDKDALDCIDGIMDLYGDLDAMELVNLTHQKNTPWDEVWSNQVGNTWNSEIINDTLIKNHYRKVISDPSMVSGL